MAGKFSAARPKRAGDAFTRAHHAERGDGPSSKKPRFDYRNPSTLAPDVPEEDAILELDEIGKTGGTKRNAVNIDGYESDSSTENFDARADTRAEMAYAFAAKARAEAEAKEDDSDEDMFGGGDEDKDAEESGATGAKPKKRAVEFLREDDILGQVYESKSGGHVSGDFSLHGKARKKDDESSSESGDDEERDRIGSDVDEEVGAGGKKKHAPKLDAFNMKGEAEEGRFDESGNFVRKAVDPDAVHDTWLDGISKKDLKLAREAHEKREAQRRNRALANDAVIISDVLSTLIANMEKGETVLESLQRLGKGKPKEKKKPAWQKNKRKNGDVMDLDSDKSTEDPAETKRKETVEAITGAADQLMMRGQTDVYDDEREKLIRQYTKETGESWVEPSRAGPDESGSTEARLWEYHWSDGRSGGEIHGPYDGATMVAWNEAGYFGEGVEFRRTGDSEWSRVVDFV
jgi:CD2 antigen cytoplasmic tail-binding protein 2